MNDFPLLGCLNQCKVLSAASDQLILEGNIFTADKINKNGWGIPTTEAGNLAKSLEGKPIRYCPQGKVLPEYPDVPAAHVCDAKQTEKDIVGEILSVYPAGVDEKGRQIYNQRARITDPTTMKGIMSGSIPSSWSIFLYARKMAGKMVQGARGAAASIVSEPAYTEADFEWHKMVASLDPSFFTLNKPEAEQPGNYNGDPIMGDPAVPNSNQAPPAPNAPAGGAPPGGVQATLPGVPPVTVNYNFPTAGNAQIPANPTPGGDGKPGEKQKQEAKTYTEEELKAAIQEAIKAEAEKAKITGLATDVVKLQVAAGVLEDKPELKDAKAKELITLSASILESMRADYTKVTETLKKQSKPGEKPMSAGFVPGAPPEASTLPPLGQEYLQKMRISPEDYEKYGKAPTRSLYDLANKIANANQGVGK